MDKDILLIVAQVLKSQENLKGIHYSSIKDNGEAYHVIRSEDPAGLYVLFHTEKAEINKKIMDFIDNLSMKYAKEYTENIKFAIYNEKLKVFVYDYSNKQLHKANPRPLEGEEND